TRECKRKDTSINLTAEAAARWPAARWVVASPFPLLPLLPATKYRRPAPPYSGSARLLDFPASQKSCPDKYATTPPPWVPAQPAMRVRSRYAHLACPGS